MRTLSRPAAVVLLAAVAVSLTACGPEAPVRDDVTGEIVEASTADAFQIRLGDCLDLEEGQPDEEVSEVETVPTVPCGEPHDGEVYAVVDLTEETFPGGSEVMELADDVCYEEFAGFVGTEWEESELDYTFFAPTAESWELRDDREVLCIVGDPEAKTTGSLKGAQR